MRKSVSVLFLGLLIASILFVSVLPLVSPVQLTGNPRYFATYSAQSTLVSGLISENTTWTLASSPYIVAGNVIVDSGVFLKIEPGVIAKFTNGTSLLIDGGLIALGNSTHKITFTSNSTTPAPNDWETIWFRGSTFIFDYCIVEFAKTGIQSGGTLSNCLVSKCHIGLYRLGRAYNVTVTDCEAEGVKGYINDYAELESCIISNNGGDGINYAICKITNSRISNNSGDGFHTTGANSYIYGNNISANHGDGIWMGGYAEVLSCNNLANNLGYDLDYLGYYLGHGRDTINATYNWWGTTNETLIKDRIYDYYDNYLYGRVIYKPYLMAPVESYPVASFLYEPSEPVVNETVTFNASNSHDSDGSIVSYSWDFGDDTYANETEPITNHTYTIAGTYIVTLNATDNDGLTNIVPARDVISVGKLNSTISISASPTTLTIGENTTINGTVTPTREGAAVTIWYRYLGEGTWSDLTVIAANENSTYSYAWTPSEPGTYELKTSWLGDENTFGAESSTITVTRLSPPAPSFTYSPSNPSVGAEMSFDASSSYDVDGDIASYRWDFDDGNISSTVTPIMVHTYVFPRTYNVTLTVIDAAGLNSSIYQSVSVKMPTSVSVLTSSSSIFVGFKVNITGTLRDIYGNELRNETIVLSYTFSGIGTWVPITSDNTDSLGNYFAVWVPPATGYFEIKAEWSGNSSHFGVSNTIAVSTVPYENQYVFTVESNSTVSDLKFAQNSKHLSFSVSGENGTTGYTRVTIAKSLIVDVTEIKVNVDGVECNYTTIELDDSWVLTFTYNHSVHQIEVDMYAAIPEFSSLLPWLLLTAVTTLCVVCRVRRKLTY